MFSSLAYNLNNLTHGSKQILIVSEIILTGGNKRMIVYHKKVGDIFTQAEGIIGKTKRDEKL